MICIFLPKFTRLTLHTHPAGPYNWIGQYIDHWSDFHLLFAIQRKSGLENLCLHITAYRKYFGGGGGGGGEI